MKKHIIITFLVLLFIVLGSFSIYTFSSKKNNDNTKRTSVNEVLSVVNLFEKMQIEEYVIDEFVLSNINLSLNDGNDSVEVTLISNESSSNVVLEVSLYDKDDELLKVINFSIDDLFEGEERTLFCYVDFELDTVEYFSAAIKND